MINQEQVEQKHDKYYNIKIIKDYNIFDKNIIWYV